MNLRQLFVGTLLAFAQTANAGMSPGALSGIGVELAPGARLPLTAIWRDERGLEISLGEALSGRPALLVFADFTCVSLCGTVLGVVANVMSQSNLDPVRDYRLLVLGLDPKDTGADAARMRQQQIGNGPHSSWAFFLRADEAGVKNAASSVGYHFAYDAEHDQFAHPAAVLVLAPDGRVTRVLSGLGLTSDDLTLALVEAAQGHIGGLGRQLQLLCYGFDPAIGVYTLSIHRALAMASGFMVVVVIAGLIALSLNSFRSDG